MFTVPANTQGAFSAAGVIGLRWDKQNCMLALTSSTVHLCCCESASFELRPQFPFQINNHLHQAASDRHGQLTCTHSS